MKIYLHLYINFDFRKVTEVKKEQDKQIREILRNLTKNQKDKAELQKEKRIHNKKHIDQVVKIRQDVCYFCYLSLICSICCKGIPP